MLQLSGVQHFLFCRRQWALIHIEGLWADNAYTVAGELLHERAHNEAETELRGSKLITRGMRVFSRALGVSGQCDVVEFHRSKAGVALHGREGLWEIYPVEYKKGEANAIDCDAAQLCAQALCLEEMLLCEIPAGSLFYGTTRRRETVEFTLELRGRVKDAIIEMHELYERAYTPRVKPGRGCGGCSLKEQCLPVLMKSRSAAAYVEEALCES